MRYLAGDAVRALGPARAVQAVLAALRDGLDPAQDPPRSAVDLAHGQFLLMPSQTSAAAGVKVATVAPENPGRGLPRIQATYLLFDPHTLALRVAPCELSSIVTEAIESLTPLAAERRIDFQADTLPVVSLEADAFRLRQIVDNVLSNAIKYNVFAGTITVQIAATDAAVELRVTDTGRGMTTEEQLHLFDRFYRADSVRGSSVHGYGLGLSISRDIARQHGGDLRLESRAGRGATAIVTLPLRR